jgi:quercetin dioxygenase-like cupin family protein
MAPGRVLRGCSEKAGATVLRRLIYRKCESVAFMLRRLRPENRNRTKGTRTMPNPRRLAALLAALLALAPTMALANPPTTPISPADLAGAAVYDGAATSRVLLSAVPAGATGALLEIRPNGRIPPHSHSQEDLVVVLVVRGPVHYADGTAFDRAALRAYEAGSILLIPHGNSHFLEAGDAGALLLAIPARREALPPAVAIRLPAR